MCMRTGEPGTELKDCALQMCVRGWAPQAFSSSALKSGHFHTINALLVGKCSSAKYTAQKT